MLVKEGTSWIGSAVEGSTGWKGGLDSASSDSVGLCADSEAGVLDAYVTSQPEKLST